MDFVSFWFYVFLLVALIFYYFLPLRMRWYALLAGNLSYFWLATESPIALALFIGIIGISYTLGIMLEKRQKSRSMLALAVTAVLIPLAIAKYSPALEAVENLLEESHGLIVPLGLSFFTMQIIAYLADIYKGKISAQHNFLKYALFISFFPQILQGPIPRYEQLEHQLVEGHRFDETEFTKGFMLIIWGFFLKLMIADKAKVVVDTIFGNPDAYRGCFVLVGGVLYSIQLYTDFLACVTLAQGVSRLFGIHLAENFNHPYFARSIKEFWGKWHMSLSFWLRDYIYIPLGGSRKGKLRKYINIIITFFVSGLWHGNGPQFIVWGMMHAFYQVAGGLTEGMRNFVFAKLGILKQSDARYWIDRIWTFLLAMTAWIMFRAASLSDGLFMLQSVYSTYNPWILFDDSLLSLGLGWKEWVVLIFSIMTHIQVSLWQERFEVCDKVLEQPFCIRLLFYVVAIIAIMAFGTYGYGFNAADFIYRGF